MTVCVAAAFAVSSLGIGKAADDPAQGNGAGPKLKSVKPTPLQLPVRPVQPRFIRPRQITEVPTKGTMQVHVLDADGKPIDGAKIHVSVWTSDTSFKRNQDYKCDSSGVTQIQLPKLLSILRVWASKDGFVPLFAHWEREMAPENRVVPEEFTFKMTKGVTIGGIVRDEDGKPISGAIVEVMLDAKPDNGKIRVIDSIWLAQGDDAVVTDARGHWSLSDVPPGAETRICVKLTHPDYVSDLDWGPPIRPETSHFAMVRGTRVTGTITEPDGKPVSGALVIWGDDPYLEHRPQQEVVTDEKGHYRFPPLLDGQMTVTVVAEGWMPELCKLTIARDITPLDFQLKKGRILRIKFVDRTGSPVPNVGVGIESWRGGKSLYNYKHPNVIDSHIPRQADASGVYEWSWAPEDAVTYFFGTKEIGTVSGVAIKADGQEHVQTLPIR